MEEKSASYLLVVLQILKERYNSIRVRQTWVYFCYFVTLGNLFNLCFLTSKIRYFYLPYREAIFAVVLRSPK